MNYLYGICKLYTLHWYSKMFVNQKLIVCNVCVFQQVVTDATDKWTPVDIGS